ncbi:MAG TPA: SGNH/GDSL hydrolase family protein [Terriglobia bacterium]|nr:SGNH/GDSL hydrolase family protein [Terriglobia bacterium]
MFSLALLLALFGPPPAAHWVGTWATAPQLVEPRNLPPAPGLAGSTLRQTIKVSLGGRVLRVRFSNEYGSAPLVIRAAEIALPAGPGAIVRSTRRDLTFHDRHSITIAPGGEAVSDPVAFPLRPLSELTVSLYFGSVPGGVTGHPGSRATSFLERGDFVSAATLPRPAAAVHWYILTGVDVLERQPAAAVVAFGDSITDGHGTTTDGNNRWPDDLARRLEARTATRNIAVLNEGIGGNCILKKCLGPAGVERFRRDVLDQPGVRWVILFEGVNDIGTSHASVAQQIIAADRKFIALAHAHSIRIYGATITPFGGSFYDSPAHEADWKAVNHWIRHRGAFDAVIDFAAVARDPAHPERLLPADDLGDHLHFNPPGYARLAASIPLRLFRLQ